MGTDSDPIAVGDRTAPSRIRGALRGVHPVWWLNAVIWTLASLLFLGPVSELSPLHDPNVAWWWLALGFLVGERCVVHLEFSRNAHSFSLGDVPLVFGLVLATGSDLVIAAVVGPALTLLLDRRLPPIKLAFNLGQFALSVCLAILICHWLAPVGTGWGPQLAIAVLVGAQVSAVICVALIGAAISLSEGWLGWRALVRMFATDLTVGGITNSSLGLVAALIVSTEPWALPLLVVPLLTVFLAYRAYVSERKRGERLEFLYEANRTLSRSPEIAEALEGLLARSLEAFRAERAEIILWAPDRPPLRTTLGPDDHKEVMHEVDDTVAAELRALVSHDMPVVTLPEAAHGTAVAGYLRERGVHKAMLAMLPGEDRVIGTLMLSNRYGVVRDFSADDIKLFETLANNASVALQYDRLEQAIARLKHLQQQLRHQAYHDSLTDLPNRALFIASVREALEKAPTELAVLFIDVDDFKTVNDTLGHAVGDELLVAVADRLRSCVRPSDEVAPPRRRRVRRAPVRSRRRRGRGRIGRQAHHGRLPAPDRGRRRAALDPPQRRHRLAAPGRPRRGRADPPRRHGDVPGQDGRQGLLRALRPRGPGGDAAPAPDEGRPAPCRRGRGAHELDQVGGRRRHGGRRKRVDRRDRPHIQVPPTHLSGGA